MPLSVTLIPGRNVSHFKFVFPFFTQQKKVKVSCNLFYNLLEDFMNISCTLYLHFTQRHCKCKPKQVSLNRKLSRRIRKPRNENCHEPNTDSVLAMVGKKLCSHF